MSEYEAGANKIRNLPFELIVSKFGSNFRNQTRRLERPVENSLNKFNLYPSLHFLGHCFSPVQVCRKKIF